MGQYFKAVNMDKKEVVCPWCLGGIAKLWEWAANPWGAVFCLLLRQSSGSGGGDYYGYRTQQIHVDSDDPKQAAKTVFDAMQSGVAMEGQPISAPKDTVVGRWAGDRVALVGDYDESKLWDELPRYRNISRDLVTEWNAFIEIPKMQLTFNDDCSCNKDQSADTEAAA